VTIVAASGPVRHADGSATNVARMFHPSGKVGEYAKLMMTPWERDPVEGVLPGRPRACRCSIIGIAKVGLVICYDIEFPLLSRALAEAGCGDHPRALQHRDRARLLAGAHRLHGARAGEPGLHGSLADGRARRPGARRWR
jgi:predicted amidohydrolase